MKQSTCRYCKNPGIVVPVDDLFYARCTHCNKWSPYEFLGTTRVNAIKNWNEFNMPKKKEQKDESI